MVQQEVSIAIAFIAGIFSFLSPCVLPLVPGYISFLSGMSLDELGQGADRKKIIKKAGMASAFFVLGFSVVFVALGASATFIGGFLTRHIEILSKIAGVIIVILGLHMVGIFKIGILNYEKRFNVKRNSSGYLTAFLLGFSFAFGWTPCIGPILAGILALAAVQQTVIKGMFLLFVYSMGLGIPFILTAFGTGAFMGFFKKYKRFIRRGEIAAGVLLIVIGVLIFFGNLNILTRFIPHSLYRFIK